MFNKKKFTSCNGQVLGTDLINDWKYVTSDPIEVLRTADYFAPVQGLLAVGDVIHVYFVSKDGNGNDTSFFTGKSTLITRMSDSAGGHVAVLPSADLCGQAVIGNDSFGTAGTITMSPIYSVTEAYCIVSGGVDSDGDSNTITVKNGDDLLFSVTIDRNIADGAVIKMMKNALADPGDFAAQSFNVTNSGTVARAHGTVTIVLNADRV